MKLTELSPRALLAIGVACIGCSAFLLIQHAVAIRTMQEDALPLLGSVATLEDRSEFLQEQMEVASLHSAIQNGSEEERVNVFILPEEFDLDRSMSVFDLIGDALLKKGLVRSVSAIELGESFTSDQDVVAHPLTVRFSANNEGLSLMNTLVRIAGLLTVGDAISNADRDLLIERTEAENPAGITALEQFFATDLLQYVHDPRAYEDALLRSFSSTGFLDSFHAVRDGGLLQDVRELLGGPLGNTLYDLRLWPLPFMQVQSAVIRPEDTGWHTIDLTVLVYSRG